MIAAAKPREIKVKKIYETEKLQIFPRFRRCAWAQIALQVNPVIITFSGCGLAKIHPVKTSTSEHKPAPELFWIRAWEKRISRKMTKNDLFSFSSRKTPTFRPDKKQITAEEIYKVAISDVFAVANAFLAIF